MATLVTVCSADCGVNGSASRIANWNPHLQRQSGGGGSTPVRNTSVFRTAPGIAGLSSWRCVASGSNGSSIITLFCGSTTGVLTHVVRFYVYFATLPSADCMIWAPGLNAVENSCVGVAFDQANSRLTTGTLASGVLTVGGTGVRATTANWYRVDAKVVIATGGNDTVDMAVDGYQVAQASAAGSTSAANCENFGLAVGSPECTGDLYLDDLAVSNTAGDYPLGAGHVVSLIPSSDGTHNIAGANDFEYTLTGTDITNATTDAYTLVNKRPLSDAASTFINMVSPPNATDYVECKFESPSTETVAPNAIVAIAVTHDATTGTNNCRVAIRDSNGGTQADIFNTTQAGNTSLGGGWVPFNTIPGGGAWTLTAAQNLRFRCYTSDAVPDPYVDAVMIEADFPDPKSFLPRSGRQQHMLVR